MITINLPNGSQKTFDHDKVSLIDVAKSISNSLAKEVLVGSSNGIIIDTNDSIKNDSKINLFTFNDDEGKNAFWHTSAHLLGAALQELYPNVQLGTGPAIENGFYYDVDFGDYKFTDADFKAVENKMLDLAKLKSKNIRSEVSKQEALAFFTLNQNKYKL
jgi:threonyl-tRNA synthetase